MKTKILLFGIIFLLLLISNSNTFTSNSVISKHVKTERSLYNIPTKDKVKACYVILVRNEELEGISSTIKQIESTFNEKYDYPYVLFNDKEFTKEFKATILSLTNSKVLFGKIDESMWGYPDYINQTYAAECRDKMAKQGVPYGNSESYRHMCRFQSGFFFRHPLLDEFEYYWRLEPDVNYYCQIEYDVFKYMKDNKKKYGFNIAYVEHIETVPTLWNVVLNFIKDNPKVMKNLPERTDTLFEFVTSDNGLTYNTCHFWSNFEIGDLSLWRSDAYLRLFDYLDRAGGFFYERWGDAPVHSIAASLLLHKNEFHFFNDIGYRHTSYTHCPVGNDYRLKCTCDPNKNFDFNEELSCYRRYKSVIEPKYKNIFNLSSISSHPLWLPSQ